MKHSLMEFARANHWQCAICGMSEAECLETPICGKVPMSSYQRAKARKQEAEQSMRDKQSEMDEFMDRLFK